ncbi:ATP-binding protein [Lewinella cohaerens]|uniref:ATP-binding protein n=1 Tax=Lewinella cohaerens TaxID=70995 RepID=UPI0003693761|nr:ATP-binding protein [Lewinella cohaerens]
MHKHKHAIFFGILLLLLVSCQNTDFSLAVPGSIPPVALLEQDQTNYKLRTFTQVLADSMGKYTLDDILQPAQQSEFLFYEDYPLPMQNYQYYWGKIQVENRLPEADQYPEWTFAFSDTWSALEIYLLTTEGHWERQLSGASTPYSQKKFVPSTKGNLVKIILPPGEVVTIYFRGISKQEEIIPSFYLFAQPLDDFYDKLVIDKTGSSIFIGFLLMMLFYNLIVYFFDRDSSFLFYSGYILAVVLYVSFSSSDLTDWLGNVLFTQHPLYYSLFKLVLFGGLMCYVAFIRSFLDLEQLLPGWDRYFKYLIYLGIPLIALSVVLSVYSNFSYKVEDQVSMFYVALVTFSCLLFLFPLYKTGDTKGRFVVAGIAIITLGFFLTLLSRLSPSTPYSIFYLKVGAIIEVIVFSLGLAYRQRQQLQAGEQAKFALKESQLIQEKKQLEADRLKELNEFKARFYTNITHEFRTPLTVIMGMSENIKGHSKEKELIKRNSASLLMLINQLLDLSKLESGSLTLNPVHQDIIVYLQYLTESFYSTATQKNIRLVFYSEEKEVSMDYDERVIQQIVYNLLSNALKFTPEGGRIVFHANKVEEVGQPLLKLKVKDTGQGISPENIDHIFDRFYQVNDTKNQQAEGTGIGLALTKELVELMNGRIEVESEKGSGTEFTLYLPIEANIAATSSQPINALLPIEEGLTFATSTALQDEASEALTSGLPELLIIEDNQDIITYIKTILHGQYLFHTAKNGALGIEQALEIIPDIIISDVMMPQKNGYEVCETLKQDERTSHIPVILLTAKATQQDKVQGLSYGADAYLTKPFDKEELMIRLKRLIEVRKQLQRRYASSTVDAAVDPSALSIEDIFVNKLHEHIHARLSDTEFGVTQLATASHLSQMQLYRKLKALTNKTPSQFIRSYRLQQGLELLKEGQLTVSEVAYEVGFADPSYFSRTFQKEFGKNPSGFLRR